MDQYPIFTVTHGTVKHGAQVATHTLSGGGRIAVLLVGEEGRGSSVGLVPLALDPPEAETRVFSARVGKTRRGGPRLTDCLTVAKGEPAPEIEPASKILAVIPTPIGYRGGNDHTGDRVGVRCTSEDWDRDPRKCTWEEVGPIEKPDTCPQCGASDALSPLFGPDPFEVLAEGGISQGAAGRMGSGAQYIALIPQGAIFRTRMSGRLYGEEKAYYYKIAPKGVLVATWEERLVTDLF